MELASQSLSGQGNLFCFQVFITVSTSYPVRLKCPHFKAKALCKAVKQRGYLYTSIADIQEIVAYTLTHLCLHLLTHTETHTVRNIHPHTGTDAWG